MTTLWVALGIGMKYTYAWFWQMKSAMLLYATAASEQIQ